MRTCALEMIVIIVIVVVRLTLRLCGCRKGVISKEVVGNSWDILNAIFGVIKVDQTRSHLANDAKLYPKSVFNYSL